MGDFTVIGPAFQWCLEIEWTHIDRLTLLLSHMSPCKRLLRSCERKEVGQLLMTPFNVLSGNNSENMEGYNGSNSSLRNKDICKYITRMFYIPHSCYHIEWILTHPDFTSLLRNPHDPHNESNTVRVKISAVPKELEESLLHALFEEKEYNASEKETRRKLAYDQCHPSQYTHVLCCVYSFHESIFRWGIVTRDFYISQFMSTEGLASLLQQQQNSALLSNGLPSSLTSSSEEEDSSLSNARSPASRAYFKLKEMIDFYLPLWKWDTCSRKGVGIDVGASPGGWSQVLSSHCSQVLAIDPGALAIDIEKTYSNVRHIPFVAQSEEVKRILLEEIQSSSVSFIVCDMNMDCRECAEILLDHILPHIPSFDEFAVLVIILKLVKNPKESYVQRAADKLQQLLLCSSSSSALSKSSRIDITDFHLVHLSANSRSERTLACRVRKIEPS